MRNTALYITLMILFVSCKNYSEKKNILENNEIAAFIDTATIDLRDIDAKVRQEIFDELNRIYYIRKIALEEEINNKILELESQKKNITTDSLLSILYKNKTNDSVLGKYINDNQLFETIPELRNSLVFHKIISPEGQKILTKRFQQFLLNQYLDSLKTNYNIEIKLTPPASPYIQLSDLLIHYRGNLDSKTTLIIISDFDCEMCRKNENVFDKLYSKYKDKVRFGYTHYGSYVSISAIASECAANQGKFWQMHDKIFDLESIPDTSDLFNIATELNLDMNSFKKDFYSNDLYKSIETNLYKIESVGIYGTPTIMINNKLIFNSASITELEKIIIKEIEQEN